MWMDIARNEHARVGNGLPSHLTDDEWVLIEPLLAARFALIRPV
ncbi:MAG: hypothetical protein RLZZ157_527 [Pseudomonadota bacterium]|jgi:hypothetical protein